MKHSKHNTISRIAATILTFAIVLTGISFDATTAEAKVVSYTKDREDIENITNLKDTTVTMKIGDEKNIDFMEEIGSYGMTTDSTNDYAWSSSDESVVSTRRFYDISVGERYIVSCLTIKAEKAGTAVIKAVNPWSKDTMSFTVVVESQKITAKMKKCSHKWKTKKKATCLESGMRVCKRCKIQKVVARKNHVFEETTNERYDYKYAIILVCDACVCEGKETRKYHNTPEGSFECETFCDEKFPVSEYGSLDEAKNALFKHQSKEHPEHRTELLGQYVYTEVPVEKVTTYEDTTVCTSCGYSKKGIDMMFEVNDPNETISVNDL